MSDPEPEPDPVPPTMTMLNPVTVTNVGRTDIKVVNAMGTDATLKPGQSMDGTETRGDDGNA